MKKEQLVIGGIEVDVFRNGDGERVSVLFLLHGRGGDRGRVEGFARRIVEYEDSGKLIVVTLDHRNHGSRLVDRLANEGWSKDESQHNPRHALDMYAIQLGTMRDVSFLIDVLPMYLGHEVWKWGVAGISLGGHSTWLALAHEPRVSVGIPIIGCPDYLALMKHRAEEYGIEIPGPLFPASLVRAPAAIAAGKEILVLSGGADSLVPWSASEGYVAGIESRVIVYAGVGHSCTSDMMLAAARFGWEKLT